MQQSELNQTDRELVRGCLENNRLVQRALYERFSTRLYTLVYRLISDHDASNDVLQDAFIEIFRSITTFRFESSLFTWMRTIVIRNAMSYVKQNTRLHVVTDEIPDEASETGFNFTAEHLEKAILSLPPQARSVFVLTEVEGYKHQEVAEIYKRGNLKVPVELCEKTVKEKTDKRVG